MGEGRRLSTVTGSSGVAALHSRQKESRKAPVPWGRRVGQASGVARNPGHEVSRGGGWGPSQDWEQNDRDSEIENLPVCRSCP